ncbi:MAG: hypothetical protein IIA54_07040 [Chloroflexi bacterium]|nr:hypothetical protein [Chloroflexota bacterium]
MIQICGYDRESGIIILAEPAQEITLAKAVAMLLEMLIDFRFATAADGARAVAAVITPALVMGGLLGGRAPIDLGEADSSQSGKGFRNKLTAAVYNHTVRTVTQKKGGVDAVQQGLLQADRQRYSNDGKDVASLGNHGWVLDPPRLTATSDRGTGDPGSPRTAVDGRHLGRANVVFCDGHGESSLPRALGYRTRSNGSFADADTDPDQPTNRWFSGTGRDDDPPEVPRSASRSHPRRMRQQAPRRA